MKKFIIFAAVCFFLTAFTLLDLHAEELFFDDFQVGQQIGEDGGLKNTPFGEIPFPFVNLYNFPGWKYQLTKPSDALISGIRLEDSPPFYPPEWPHDYSIAPMSSRALTEDGMLGVANDAGNRFLHLGGPFLPMFSPNENIFVSKNIPINQATKYLLIEFDYLVRTLDGIPGKKEDNDKAYAKVEFLNFKGKKMQEVTLMEWSRGTPGIGNPETGMLYSDTDGGFAPFGKLIADNQMDPASYQPVNLQTFSQQVKFPKGAREIFLTFGLITDSDPWASCFLIDNVRVMDNTHVPAGNK